MAFRRKHKFADRDVSGIMNPNINSMTHVNPRMRNISPVTTGGGGTFGEARRAMTTNDAYRGTGGGTGGGPRGGNFLKNAAMMAGMGNPMAYGAKSAIGLGSKLYKKLFGSQEEEGEYYPNRDGGLGVNPDFDTDPEMGVAPPDFDTDPGMGVTPDLYFSDPGMGIDDEIPYFGMERRIHPNQYFTKGNDKQPYDDWLAKGKALAESASIGPANKYSGALNKLHGKKLMELMGYKSEFEPSMLSTGFPLQRAEGGAVGLQPGILSLMGRI